MSNEAFLTVNNLAFAYPTSPGGQVNPPVLKGVNLTVRRGEFVAILGANGSGKSTLARHLNGLFLPTAGEVHVDGLLTSDEANLWPIRDRVGMVFQNPDNQIVAAVVEEDVAFGPENQGLPPEQIRERVAAALGSVGLLPLREREPHLLSGGQKQRVAIAGALALQPSCLVLDEPTAMLDPSGRAEVAEVVQRLRAELGMTVIWITHHMEEAALADRVVVMEAGQVVLEGAPRQVFQATEQLRSLRLSLPPAVAAATELRASGLPLPGEILTMDELVEALCQLHSKT